MIDQASHTYLIGRHARRVEPAGMRDEAMGESRGSPEVLGEDVRVEKTTHSGISRVEG